MKVILKQPVISEKSISQGAVSKYTFVVGEDATKPEIAKAVESAFKVKVTKVNRLTLPGKPKRYRRISSQRSDRHYAVVTLKSGDRIPLFEEGGSEPTPADTKPVKKTKADVTK